jgi:DNA-binding XRE family transcriptional regulator
MSAVVKTHHIKISNKANFHFALKKSTPRKIITEISNRYAPYIVGDPVDELIDISTTDWYKSMAKKMLPEKYLKTYREAAGFSQAHLGNLLGIPASRISDYETGQRTISKEVAKKLADLFKTSPAVFI